MMSKIPEKKLDKSLDRLTEPGLLITRFCGYDLRTCALYILWVDVILLFTIFTLLVVVGSFITFRITVHNQKNKTSYHFFDNKEKLITVTIYQKILGIEDVNFPEIGTKFIEILLCIALIDMIVSVLGLVGVYYNTYRLITPYVLLLSIAIIWLTLFLIIDTILIIWNLTEPVWLLSLIFFIFLLQKIYKFVVIYSYYSHHHSYHTTQTIIIPKNLTTESPLILPTSW